MDEAIADGMLEYLWDDLSVVTAEEKNTGGLLAHDEKKGIERLIEGLQLVPWSSMERSSRPPQSKLPPMNSLLGAATESDIAEAVSNKKDKYIREESEEEEVKRP